jgi:RNA polymerase sigma-70 factor (ECF subfamily)
MINGTGSGNRPAAGPALAQDDHIAVSDRTRVSSTQDAEWSGAGDLVRRIVSGDLAAEHELVDQYQRGVRLIVARSSRDRSVVDDICQDVLCLAIEKIRAGAVREPERLSGFIAALARTKVIEHFRGLEARGAREARARGLQPAAPPDALEQVLARERAELIRAVLDELGSDRDRQILLRYYLADEEKLRICRDLKLTTVHFNRVLFRARERFRHLLRNRLSTRTPDQGAG